MRGNVHLVPADAVRAMLSTSVGSTGARMRAEATAGRQSAWLARAEAVGRGEGAWHEGYTAHLVVLRTPEARRRSGCGAVCRPFAKGEFPTRVYMVRSPAAGIPGNSTTPRRMRGCTTRSEVAFTANSFAVLSALLKPARLTAVHQLGMISTPSRVGNRRDRRRGLKARVGKGVASGVPVYVWPSSYVS